MIFDGEIHILDKEYAYILEYANEVETRDPEVVINQAREKFLKKYVEYLDKNNAELKEENYSVIYRPYWTCSFFEQYGTISLKFKRAPNDGLDAPKKDFR